MDSSYDLGLVEAPECFRSAPIHSTAIRHAIAATLNAYIAGVLDEFRNESEAFLHFLRLAVNEAEALAWSTPYAHWLLPGLVEEKIHSIRQWAEHQHRVSPGLHPSKGRDVIRRTLPAPGDNTPWSAT